MWYERDASAPVAHNRLYIEKPRPFPQFPDINYADKGGSHDYQGLTSEAERRFSKGLFFQIAYTAARDLGDTGGNAPNGGIYTDERERRQGHRGWRQCRIDSAGWHAHHAAGRSTRVVA
jgi:hypothetical protein